MNPLTNVKNITKLNEIELSKGLVDKKSWHDIYKDSAWIFIGGLTYGLTEGDILAVFSQYGEIVNINLVRDKKTGKTKGFGFLCYANQKSTILAVDNFNGIKLCGRTIRVDHVSNYKPPKDNENDDDLTKQLKTEGCAPKPTQSERIDVIETLEVEKKKKKDKKEKKKHKIRKKKEQESTHRKVKVKKEKHDPGYAKYENLHKNHNSKNAEKSRSESSSDEESTSDSSNTRDKNYRSARNLDKMVKKNFILPEPNGLKIKKEPRDLNDRHNNSNTDSSKVYVKQIKHEHKISSTSRHSTQKPCILRDDLFSDKKKSDYSHIRDKYQSSSNFTSHKHDSQITLNTNKGHRLGSNSDSSPSQSEKEQNYSSTTRSCKPDPETNLNTSKHCSNDNSNSDNSLCHTSRDRKQNYSLSTSHSVKLNKPHRRNSSSSDNSSPHTKRDKDQNYSISTSYSRSHDSETVFYAKKRRRHDSSNSDYSPVRTKACHSEKNSSKNHSKRKKSHHPKDKHEEYSHEESRQHSKKDASYRRRSLSLERKTLYSKREDNEEYRRDKKRRDR